MCRRVNLVSNGATVLGFALLLSLIIPRCFVTVCVGISLIALGCALSK
ncbi:MAG: hypothetical protein R3Y62_05100 [Eubacteriales bacterium]